MQIYHNPILIGLGGLCLLVAIFLIARRISGAPQSSATIASSVLLAFIGLAGLIWTFLPRPAPPPQRLAAVTAAPIVPTAPAAPDLVISSDLAFADCVPPTAPTIIPDGASATIDQMRQAHTAVSGFDAATTTYIACVDAAAKRVGEQERDAASVTHLQLVNSMAVSLHNAAVDKDHGVADRLNQQIRVYKAKHAS